jgi:hypothetical protein
MLTPGEAPLCAFISSVQRPELEWARQAAVRAFSAPPLLRPWAFEFTPASSETASDAYLSKVREADLVVWLVGAETTEPVRREIGEAISKRRRLIVVRLPAKHRDDATRTLLSQTDRVSKRVDAADEAELVGALALTVSDEVARAMRGKPPLTALASLDVLERVSIARCREGWIAARLDRDLADDFALNRHVGEPSPQMVPTAEDPLKLVIGDVGSGKSLVAERILQSAIDDARSNVAAPIPVFVHARAAGPDFEASIAARARELGDPAVRGVFLVVDGLDEIEDSRALQIIRDARVLMSAWPESRAVMTSRPIQLLAEEAGRVLMPPLLDDAARKLISKAAGREVSEHDEHGWPASIVDASRRPLFALLLGASLKTRRGVPSSVGGLLDNLVTSALGTQPRSVQLERLAVASTDSGGSPIPTREFGSHAETSRALSTGLVRSEGQTVAFALPILAEWFAAQSLINGSPSIGDLAADPTRVDRWRYPLAVFVAVASQGRVNDLLSRLATRNPGAAIRALMDGSAQFFTEPSSGSPPPDTDQAGRLLRLAYESWIVGLAPGAEPLLPRRRDGSIATVAVRVFEHGMLAGWDLRPDSTADVVEFPDDLNFLQPADGWDPRFGGDVDWSPPWPWLYTLDDIRRDLRSVVAGRLLPTDTAAYVAEALWVIAQAIERRRGNRLGVTELDPAELAKVIPTTGLIPTSHGIIDTALLLAHLRLLEEAGEMVRSPWPEADGPWPNAWTSSSAERQLERARAVFLAAMEAYPRLVEHWFPLLAPRMPRYVTLPARLVGRFEPGGDETARPIGWPVLQWYLDPLPRGATSEVSIELGRDERSVPDLIKILYGRLVEARPQQAPWLLARFQSGIASELLRSDPLCAVLYDWLNDDLRSVGLA